MGSQGIGSVREFIKMFVDSMPIGPDEVQVGVAQFGTVPRIEMDLNTYRTREDIIAALGGIKPRPGQTINIGAALDFVRTNMLLPEKGSRREQGVPQLLLLVTSKQSSDRVEEPARALLQMSVLILAAGAKTASGEELKKIAFTNDLVYMLRDIRVLGRPAAAQPKLILHTLSTLAGGTITEVPTETGNFVSFKHFEKTKFSKKIFSSLDAVSIR